MINDSAGYGPPEELTPVTIKFFYWLDPWGVQWEMEEGDGGGAQLPTGVHGGLLGRQPLHAHHRRKRVGSTHTLRHCRGWYITFPLSAP
jgi:hypothetical protein